MRKPFAAAPIALLTLVLGVPAQAASGGAGATEHAIQEQSGAGQFSVLFEEGTSAEEAGATLADAGAEVLSYNDAVGLATVQGDEQVAAEVATAAAVEGVAQDRVIGMAPSSEDKGDEVEDIARINETLTTGTSAARNGIEPLQDLLWGHERIDATRSGSYDDQRGHEGVLVGVMDTGIDATHPDIAPNFSHKWSRNFTTDRPIVDGECADDPDGSCEDPADVDEDGHGTHVAGTIAAADNGIGIAGIAPQVTLVNLRAGQDSGYFFLGPTVEALTYAAEIGVDVVNMSFYIDPWLYNCPNNPADSPAAQAEQRTIIKATQRALDYAHGHGVTLISAAGNGWTDLGMPEFDDTSPDFPPDSAYEREVDNSCLNMPTEGEHVIAVTAVGPSDRKAYYSDYGIEQADVAAPGGDYYDEAYGPGNVRNLILSAYPESVGRAVGDIDPAGNITPDAGDFVLRDCARGKCAYYSYSQGTSMAAPHATGVAALIVSEHGRPDPVHGGLTLDPAITEHVLLSTADEEACPTIPMEEYYPYLIGEQEQTQFAAECVGSKRLNGFYGHGVVDAQAAVDH